jgi:hypothetical protein
MDLPVHRTIFLVDVEKYGDKNRTTQDLLALRKGLYGALETAFLGCGLPWADSRLDDGGDGLFVLVPADVPKSAFVERFPEALAAAVRAHNDRHPEHARMRVRVALHAGEIAYDEHGVAAPAIIKAFRLLDAGVLKRALAESDGVLALICSAWFFEEVVRQSADANATTYRRVKVKVKETREAAWIARPDDPYPPAARRAARKRWRIAVAATVVAAVAAVGVKLVFDARAETFLGDPRTVDPCALTYAEALSHYGLVEATDHYGNFDRCDALVRLASDPRDVVDVRVQLASDADEPGLPVQQDGEIGIQRPPAEPDRCSRTLLLPDDAQVVVQADQDGDEKVDLCGMAEAVLASALSRLQDHQIKRRELAPGSLAAEQACPLLDPGTVKGVLGDGPVQQTPSLTNWNCRWDYTDRPGVVKVIFDRTEAEDLEGTPLALPGFGARLQPAIRSRTSCAVAIVYRTYPDEKHVDTDELVIVDVENSDAQPDRLCEPARQLANTVAQRLRS